MNQSNLKLYNKVKYLIIINKKNSISRKLFIKTIFLFKISSATNYYFRLKN